jgi:serine/threonine protein phosphatase 1
MRTFVIGDIHGGLRALTQLLERISPKKEDKFIFLGDYVDGWSESAQVIDYLIDMNEQYDCIFIKGNHDVWCEEWLQGKSKTNDLWQAHGGIATMNSYAKHTQQQKNEHLEFFERMRFCYVENGNLFVHAGFTSIHGVFHEQDELTLCWDRSLWEMAIAMDKTIDRESKFYPRRLRRYNEIYVGHTPTTQLEIEVPMNAINVWNVDTGAAFKGSLSAIEIQNKEIFQSDAVYLLYPEERGRN